MWLENERHDQRDDHPVLYGATTSRDWLIFSLFPFLNFNIMNPARYQSAEVLLYALRGYFSLGLAVNLGANIMKRPVYVSNASSTEQCNISWPVRYIKSNIYVISQHMHTLLAAQMFLAWRNILCHCH